MQRRHDSPQSRKRPRASVRGGFIEPTGIFGSGALRDYPEACGSSPAANDPTRRRTRPDLRTQRLVLHLLRHRHPDRPARLARCPAPLPRPRRGPHPLRQGHRTGPVPLEGVRDQPGVARVCADRDRPARLDPNHPANNYPALAKAEPKTLRYRLLHVAAPRVRGGRRLRLKIGRTWHWAALSSRRQG